MKADASSKSRSKSRSYSRSGHKNHGKKSPIMPLRNRGIDSRNSDRRTSIKNLSKQSNHTKKALNKLYSFNHKKKLNKVSSSISMVPSFRGCAPGGYNATLHVPLAKATASTENLQIGNLRIKRVK
jgi:hypothetical protein